MILCPACGEVPKLLLVQDDHRTRDLACRCGASICRRTEPSERELWLFGSPVRWLVYDSQELPSLAMSATWPEDGAVPPHLAGDAISRVVCSMVLSS